MSDRHPQVCEACYAELRGHWIAGLWQYCSHWKIMVRRLKTADTWTVDRGVSPVRARLHVSAALKKMESWCKARGISLAEAWDLLNALRAADEREKRDGPNGPPRERSGPAQG